MIDFSMLKIIPAGDAYNEFFFQARKEAFWSLIERVWGKWDEAFQRKTYAEEMEGLKPEVILYNNQPIGCCCLMKREDCYTFNAFFVLPKYQNKGIGTYVLSKKLEIADKEGMPVRLRHWNFNPAASLYARMGFKEIGRIEFEGKNDYLVLTEREPRATVKSKKIEFSSLKIIPADESHYDFTYRVKKEAYGKYITQIWGWDENLQREFYAQDWEKLKPSVILYRHKPIGTICISTVDESLHIERFYILPEYQNKGIGSYLLKQLLEKADKENSPTKLCVLKINPAISLYRRHGYEIIAEDETMYYMERQPGGNNAI